MTDISDWGQFPRGRTWVRISGVDLELQYWLSPTNSCCDCPPELLRIVLVVSIIYEYKIVYQIIVLLEW